MRTGVLPLLWLCLSLSWALQSSNRLVGSGPSLALTDDDESMAEHIDHLKELFRKNPGILGVRTLPSMFFPPHSYFYLQGRLLWGIPEGLYTPEVDDYQPHKDASSVEIDLPEETRFIQTGAVPKETDAQKVARLLLSGFRSPVSAVADKNQRGWPASYAIDHNIKSGYAYSSKLPATIMFKLATGGLGQSVHRILFRTAVGWRDHHITKFELRYTTANNPNIRDESQWSPIAFIKFLNKVEGGKIVDNEVSCAGQEILILQFPPIICTAITVTILGSDSPNRNGVLSDFRVAGPQSGNNIALGKPTSQSSIAHGGSSKRGVDGGTNTRWHSGTCTHTNRQVKPWWRVDLGAKYDIDQVVVYNRGDCCWNTLNGFKVMVSSGKPNMEDILPSTLCAPIGRNLGRGEKGYVNCLGIEGDHVTVFLPGRITLTVCEVEVYPRLEINIARGRGWDPRLTDGVITPSPSVNVGSGKKSLTLDLQAVYAVSRVVVRRVYDDSRTYKSEVYQSSQRGRSWNTFYNTDSKNVMGQGYGGDVAQVTTQVGVSVPLKERNARFFRFWSNGSDKSHENEYTEIEVFVRSGSRNGAGSCGPIASKARKTASSSWNYRHGPHCSSLFGAPSSACYSSAWCARGYSNKEYLQFEFPNSVSIYAIATQGRGNGHQWVTAYKVVYFEQGSNTWRTVEPNFKGNTDMNSVVMHTLSKVLITNAVRLYIMSWRGHPSMRVELYGCFGTGEDVAIAHPTTSSSIAKDRAPSRAVDGKRFTIPKECAATERELKPWFRVDMGMSYEVDHVVVLNVDDVKAAASSKNMQTAVTPGVYDKVADIPSAFLCEKLGYQIPPGEYAWIECDGYRGRYVYIYLNGVGEEQLNLCEVNVFPRADRNVVLGTSLVSKILSDQILSSKPFYNAGEGVRHVDLDLGFTRMISSINIRHGWESNPVYRAVVVQISLDNKNWETVFNNDGADFARQGLGLDAPYAEVPEGKDIFLYQTPAARYVRLWSAGNSKTADNRYVEVEVFVGRVAIPDLRGPTSFESFDVKSRFWRHRNFMLKLDAASAGTNQAARDASWIVVKGLTGRGVSFQSANFPNRYLRHQGYLLKLHPKESSPLFKKDATFLPRPGLTGGTKGYLSFESVNFPGYFIYHGANNVIKIEKVQKADPRASFRPTYSLLPQDGSDGARGPTGAVGPRGIVGSPGQKGEKGPTGPIGPQGRPGPRGVDAVVKDLIGPKGTPGKPGNPGTAGGQGLPGAKGPQGKKGSQGERGPKGPPGRPGQPGKGGFAKSAGAPGKPGDPGPVGARGPPGFDGPKGAKGQQGEVGSPGLKGPDGPQGDQGDPGPPGIRGDPAVKGPKGKQGPDGLLGPEGPPGHKGPHGKPGSRGAQGEFGPPGPPGKAGDGAASRAEEKILTGLEREIQGVEKALTAQTDEVRKVEKENVRLEGLARKALAEAQAKVAAEDAERAKAAAAASAIAEANAKASKPAPPPTPPTPPTPPHPLKGKIVTLGPENYI